jgi:tetratricopeptide (TPR) repeat protein
MRHSPPDNLNRTSSAEGAYLFRHSLLRDAAYQLQMPGDRARLHKLVLEILEEMAGGRPPLPDLLLERIEPHPIDPFSPELVEHIRHCDQAQFSGDVLRVYLARAAAHAERNFQNTAAIGFLNELAKMDGDDAWQSQCTFRAAEIADRAGLTAVAQSLAYQSLEMANRTNRIELQRRSHRLCAWLCQNLNEPEKAELHFSRLRDLRIGKSASLEAVSELCTEAAFARSIADLPRCESLARSALEFAAVVNSPKALSMAHGVMGNLKSDQQKYAEAEQHHRRSIELKRQLGLTRSLAISFGNLGNVLESTKHLVDAGKAYSDSLQIFQEIGDQMSEAIAISRLGTNRLELGDLAGAEQLLSVAITRLSDLGNFRFAAVALGNLAHVFYESGRYAECLDAAQRALTGHRKCRNRVFEANVLLLLADFTYSHGQVLRCGEYMNDAVSIFLELHMPEAADSNERVRLCRLASVIDSA